MIIKGYNESIGEFKLIPLEQNSEEDFQICKDIFTDINIMKTASLFNKKIAKNNKSIKKIFNFYTKDWNSSGIGQYKIVDEKDKILGICGTVLVKKNKHSLFLDLGYFIKKDFHSKHLGNDVVKLMLNYYLNLKSNIIILATAPFDNIASQTILLKNNFQFQERIKKLNSGIVNCFILNKALYYKKLNWNREKILNKINKINQMDYEVNQQEKHYVTFENS